MVIPNHVQHLLKRLTHAGYEAYAVGGCVRDSLLGRSPNDWDVCTSALPEETKAVFHDSRVIETGLQHGTVTVMLEGRPYEITTFRQDGTYADHRHPDGVQFVRSLQEDLARRDFTVNAMACDVYGRIFDFFGGQQDLRQGIIRCVGDPHRRFHEDALRILRGLRFASQLGFSIAPETGKAMNQHRDLLDYVSAERIYSELTKLLIGPGAPEILSCYSSVLSAVLPEITPAVGFLQQNPNHNRDVWGHTLEALSHAPQDPVIRWALLLHDLGKPHCFSVDEQGVGHFYGHCARSHTLARDILDRLKVDSHTKNLVCQLVLYHDYDLPATSRCARRWIAKFGPEAALPLLEVKRCDCLAHAPTPKALARYENLMELTQLVRNLMEEAPCFSARDLAVSGSDILSKGVAPGPQVGKILNLLLEDVLEERCENSRDALLLRLDDYVFTMSERTPHDR